MVRKTAKNTRARKRGSGNISLDWHTHTQSKCARTHAHTLARMFARFSFHVSLFALLVPALM